MSDLLRWIDMKNVKSISALLICVVFIMGIIFFTTACGNKTLDNHIDENSTEDITESVEYLSEVGIGEKTFVLNVVYIDGTSDSVIIHTDKSTVGEALSELNILDGEQGAYGLYVKSVNGVVADYNTDGTYWAFYVNGNYSTKGCELTDIEENAMYSFVVEK